MSVRYTVTKLWCVISTGRIDTPGVQDNSSLQSVIEKPPIGGKPLIPLTGPMLSGFKLHPGPVSVKLNFYLLVRNL